MQPAEIASKIKDKVTRDMGALVHRDRALLAAVCKELGVIDDAVNMTQVMVAMGDANLVTHEEFPKMVYPDGEDKPGVVVNDAAAEKAVHKTKPAPVKAVK